MICLRYLVLMLSLAVALPCNAQSNSTEPTKIFYALRGRMLSVNDYVADVRMKIDVSFMRVPLLAGKLYYKAPGKLKLERSGGISILPRKSITLSIDKMMPSGNATVIDAGRETIG